MGARHLLLASFVALSLPACVADANDDELVDESSEAVKDLYRFKVIEHNIAGGMVHKGQAKGLDGVDAEIADFHPDVVLLSEVCQTQYDAFKQRHPGWDVHFRVNRLVHPECQAGGGPLGNLIATPQKFENVVEYDLGEPEPGGNKKYILLCGTMSVPKRKGDVRACSTHLLSRGDDAKANEERRARQVKKVVDAVRPRLRKNEPVVIAGDFNAAPWRPLLDPMYRLTRNGTFDGEGDFDEADQTDPKRAQYAELGVKCAPTACRSGANTHEDSKMDQIFFSHDGIGGEISGDVRGTGGSDHHIYRASAQLKLKSK